MNYSLTVQSKSGTEISLLMAKTLRIAQQLAHKWKRKWKNGVLEKFQNMLIIGDNFTRK